MSRNVQSCHTINGVSRAQESAKSVREPKARRGAKESVRTALTNRVDIRETEEQGTKEQGTRPTPQIIYELHLLATTRTLDKESPLDGKSQSAYKTEVDVERVDGRVRHKGKGRQGGRARPNQ